ncbi:MAG: hypothetical protein KC897_07785 [Candidatus Omnitrophica bacterium]|nr:hypothetical protein [Candidatus Omnitrophota bacterium]MCB9722350.1 hypothetical protein [Candidatus Omnitrophota bacterium]
MLPFTKTDWLYSLIFIGVFAVIVLVPCIIIALMGRKAIKEMGRYPTRIPLIQSKMMMPLLMVDVVTFALLVGFYNVFSGQ